MSTTTKSASPIELYSGRYFYTCGMGGALACGLTHAFVTPLDLVKCRRQIDPKLYSSIFDGWAKIGKAQGISGLYTGVGPTLIGYSLQGSFKYGFYELFKYQYSQWAGEENSFKYRTALYLAASASAEVIADVALCPWEALKVRMQTSTTPFAAGTVAGFNKILATEGVNGFFKGLTPLWLRQIPYTMMKFATFEKIVEAIYSQALSRPKHEYNKMQQLGVSFVGGYLAGIICAIVSHPADTLVSKLNNVPKAAGESTMQLSSRIMKDLGMAGIWRGLGARIVMIGTLTALQWLIYDVVKVQFGLPTTGSTEKK
ncbi:Cu/Pi carrier [Dimargaris cristalligena]|uniref:Mitochondrial phosphate carrier protein n=1 Tax=Dimargaris cristalligena TaxID=215637 RepID=A0A4Q0A2W6_9FUNG|nr:Cu/Pi carrier [Dimargaris cristalligena]RKP39540.1 mitochondrial phosphate carrier protein [Dimargaris cristalligena]|eukprot:RKP39540.1 mitochondrial phosphate carrier protein [Dimargaris cristalligena]